ncbi:zinc finger protein 226 [Mastacembelus armatus]|uniref:Uncharacterized LOC113133967 n=1 Tax=Mastacembelus armatus TaxID=205130 RepID=A0A3Q3MNW7_9TELE|nr:zinc finger protein 226-like [Mastacembelus armatus]
MSASTVNLQAQVESVLGALLKAATLELTELFESRYRAAVVEVHVGRTEDTKQNETPDCLSTAHTKRSVGVQVDEHVSPLLGLSGPPLLSEGDCSRECKEEEEEGVDAVCLFPEILLPEDNGHVEPKGSPLKEQVLAETGDMLELSILETESPAANDVQTDVVLHETCPETLKQESTITFPAKQKPIVIQPDTSDITSGEKVKFVCPLILKPESPAPKPECSKKPPQAEPQQGCVSTAKGTAYSPSPSDGAATPAQIGVWERIHTPKETKNNLHMKLKLTSPDHKLMRACAVQLVDVFKVSESQMKFNDNVSVRKTGWPLPKDLRHHQGVHTGHRLCCFTTCGEGVWRLQKIVTHSRDGYVCSTCRKTFKRRKILRRHERFHTGEKPYSCSACPKTFALRKSLRRHFRFHTGERPHTCTQCSKSFRLRDNLKAHLRFHTGEKPFSCAMCGKMFRIMRNLEKHKLSQCGVCVPSFRTIAGL